MKKRQRFCIIFINLGIFVIANLPCFAAESAGKNVKEANRFYQKGKFDEALQKYNDASISLPDSSIVNFNMAAALYKKEDYRKAIDFFTKVLISEDKKLEADALYNLGNCKYKLGKLKENADLPAAISFSRESLDYYKRAIELDQKNIDARFNHEFVEKELKILLDKLKQQKPNEDKQKNQQEQQQQDRQNQGACSAGKESSGSAQDNQNKENKQKEESAQAQEQEKQSADLPQDERQKKGKEGREEQSQQEEKQQKDRQAAAEESRQKDENKELSEKDARLLLERYDQDEAPPDYADRRVESSESEVSKDW